MLFTPGRSQLMLIFILPEKCILFQKDYRRNVDIYNIIMLQIKWSLVQKRFDLLLFINVNNMLDLSLSTNFKYES